MSAVSADGAALSAVSPADEVVGSVARSLSPLGFAEAFVTVDFVAFLVGLTAAGLLGGTEAVSELVDEEESSAESEESEASLVERSLSEGDGLLAVAGVDEVTKGGIVTPVDDATSGGFSVGICVTFIGFF